jgi:glycosyltransferase involved in cell wall biosynthesis
MGNPVVSVCMITYNHESYIREAIEGVLMQKTNFPIELIIGEDCSTDNTRKIVREYENKYPEIIVAQYPETNRGMMKNFTTVLQSARGKYIALCEGDDYWTDPLKLQKQVDFLEENPDCSFCFHASKTIRNNNPVNYLIHKPKKIPADNKFEIKNAILNGGGFMATNSMVFHREHILKRPDWMNKSTVGDLPLMLHLASKGKIGYIDNVMSVYRVMSSSNSWSASMKNRALRKKHHYTILNMWSDFDTWTEKKYHRFVVQKKLKNKWNYFKGRVKQSIK